MKRDFTLETYRLLLDAVLAGKYAVQTTAGFLQKPEDRVVILRHDVDKRPGNALRTARIEKELGLRATYYFRAVKQSFNEPVINRIVELGHELGYHYEDLTLTRGDKKKAIENFSLNLERLRSLAPVKTICMHGSPVSRWDNRKLWEEYDYRDFDIIGEPYYDLDFNEVLYLTDTGRRWNGFEVSVRDRVDSAYKIDAKTTADVIGCLYRGEFSDRVMINTHPQRWDNALLPWAGELVMQNLKNIVKRIIVKSGNRVNV
ncbi:MAG: hypothetical protein KAW12_15415 [Candidatus Aminicenantes bacterium]|nr:hypothetical protein [Candidatus Aminicenantes bacterium]